MPDDDEVRAAAAKGAWIDFDDDELAAELLYSILADEDSTPKPRSLKIRRAHVAGTLDLEAVTLRCPMRMEDCRFDEPITLEEAIAPAIRLIDCELVRLEAPQLETRGDLDLTRSTVSSGVSLRGAHIGGQLILRGASLAADDAPALDAAGVRVEQDMYCDHDGEKRFSARGGVAISRAYIGGVVGFNGAELTGRDGKALQADGARVVRAMGCSAANSHPFTAHGEVNLRGAHLDSLSMHGAVLTNEDGPAFEADMLRVDKSLIFGSSDHSGFEAIGEVRLGGCRVGVQLIFEGASLSNPSGVALRADGVHVVRGLYFDIFGDRRFVAKGEVRLVGAHAEELVFDGACLTDSKVSLRAAGLDIAGDAIFEGHDDRRFTAAGGLQLRAARIGGELSFTQASIGAEAIAIDLSDSDVASLTLLLDEVPAGALDLRRARVGAMAEMSRADGTWVKAHLDGCAYRSIEARPRVSVDARLKWLESDPDGYSPQPYEQLAEAYRRAGHEASVRKIGIAKQKRRREKYGAWGKAKSLFLGATVAHGYRPSQVLLWLASLLAAGSVFFGSIVHDSDITKAKADPVDFEPVIYTLDLLIPVISLGQRTAWNVDGIGQWVALGFTFFGWLMTAALLGGIAVRRQ